jgi:uncharacterized protein YjiK
MTKHVLSFVLTALLLGSCRGRVDEPAKPAGGHPPYAFEEPDAIFRLPPELEEISGLTVLDDGLLGAVQDEDGILFVIDPETGSVVRTVPFGDPGDYEGITRAEDAIFVLRSDGALFEIRNVQDGPETEVHDTHLHADCNAEGLVYDEERARLLIACKDSPGPGLDGQKAIYAFDLESRALDPEPAILIGIDTFLAGLEERNPIDRRIRSLLSPAMDLSGFALSGLAFHPQTKELYVLSGRRKAVVVLDSVNAVTAVWELSETLYAQPEGITFLPDGTLFISNEARDRGAATLLRFGPRENQQSRTPLTNN